MSDVKTKNPVGRPKFEITDEVLLNVENLMTKGLTKEQASGMLGVSLSTFMLHQSENSEFSDAIKRGQARGIDAVTNALFEKATIDRDNTAMIFFLKNRAGWVDKQEVATTVEQKHVIDLTRIPDEQLKSIEAAFSRADARKGESGAIPQIIEGVYES